MAVSKVNEILETQKRLAEQLRMTQQQQAQDTYNQGQRALSEQLRGQRLENQSNRESLAQQAYLAQRNIQQGATSRGLGGSGLRNLATIQSQQAQGEGLRNLAGINAGVQREGLNSRLALQDQLKQGMMASEADYLNRLSQSDQFALQREDMDRDTLMQLLEMTQAEGANPELLNQLAQVAFGENYTNIMKNLGLGGTNENGETVDNPLLNLVPDGAPDLFDKAKLSPIRGIGKLDEGYTYEEDFWNGPKIMTPNGTRIQLKEAPQGGGQIWVDENGKRYSYYNFSGRTEVLSQEQAKERITKELSNKKYIGTGSNNIKIKENKGGIGFYLEYNGKTFNSYAKAVKYLEKKNKK